MRKTGLSSEPLQRMRGLNFKWEKGRLPGKKAIIYVLLHTNVCFVRGFVAQAQRQLLSPFGKLPFANGALANGALANGAF